MTESVGATKSTIEIDYYYERVAGALADLPAEARDELLEDLPAHFAEVLEEQGGSLVERLGPPATYAAELRAAAGLDAGPAGPGADRTPISVYYDRFVAALPELDRRAGGVIGYPRATEFLLLLRPAWWVARGVCLVVLLFAADILPTDRFDDPLGWVLVAVAALVSVRIGATGRPRMPRWAGLALTAAAVIGAVVIAVTAPGMLRQYTSQDYYPASNGPFDGVTNVFPVDQNGNSLENVTLYDQNGNPIQVGDYWRCLTGPEPKPASYPLCLHGPRPTEIPEASAPVSPSVSPSVSPAVSPSASTSPSPSASVVSPSPSASPPPSR